MEAWVPFQFLRDEKGRGMERSLMPCRWIVSVLSSRFLDPHVVTHRNNPLS